MKGVDVSVYQKNLTIKQIKQAGFEFAILRGGFTGYGQNRTKNKDTVFETFYAQAKEIGFPVGVYYYSCATNKAEGEAEAKFLYDNCLKGKQFEFPIYLDVEESRWQKNKKKQVTEAIIGFCDYLEKLGFYVGVYSSLDWFKNQIDTAKLTQYTKWVACWSNKKPAFGFNAFDVWQNSSSGKVGVTRIDTDESFVDFPSIIKKAGLNGFSKEKPTQTKPIEKPIEKPAEKMDVIHVVKRGETLTGIAKKYGTSVDAIVKKNGIKNKNLIFVGQKLKI